MRVEKEAGGDGARKLRFIHCADVHLGYDQYSSNERFLDYARAFASVAKFALDKEVDFVVIAGDLFNKRAINAATLQQACAVLRKLKDAGIPVIAIEGNHDLAYYYDKMSWLRYLVSEGLIVLLDPLWGEENIMARWDQNTQKGAYFDIFADEHKERADDEIPDVRIFGLSFLGSATAKKVADVSARIGKECSLGKFNIMLMHAGVEGYVAQMSGGITVDELLPLKDKIDYLALGHVHMSYELDGWVFNPGSTETWNIQEWNAKHGFYFVEIESGTPELRKMINDRLGRTSREEKFRISRVEHVNNKNRKFCRYHLKVQGLSSPEAVYDAVRSSFEKISHILGMNGPPLEKPVYDELDRPVIEYTIIGNLSFDPYSLDLKKIEDMLGEKFNALIVLVKNETVPPDFGIEINVEEERVNKYKLELDVIEKMIERDERYSYMAKGLAQLAIELKEAASTRAPQESLLYIIERNLAHIERAPDAENNDENAGLAEIFNDAEKAEMSAMNEKAEVPENLEKTQIENREKTDVRRRKKSPMQARLGEI